MQINDVDDLLPPIVHLLNTSGFRACEPPFSSRWIFNQQQDGRGRCNVERISTTITGLMLLYSATANTKHNSRWYVDYNDGHGNTMLVIVIEVPSTLLCVVFAVDSNLAVVPRYRVPSN